MVTGIARGWNSPKWQLIAGTNGKGDEKGVGDGGIADEVEERLEKTIC